MKKSVLDGLSAAGLVLSLVAVCDLLGRFEVTALTFLYAAWGLFCILGCAVVMLVPSLRKKFHAACAGGSRLLLLRTVLALALFLLGWYVNSAMEALYGSGSSMVAGNHFRMLCLIFNLAAHVVYLGFTKRPLTVEPEDGKPKTRGKR